MVDQIVSGVFLSDLAAARSKSVIQNNGITHILSVCPDFPSSAPNHLCIPVNDTEYDNLLIHLPNACAWIQNALDNNGRVLVHCVMGISRSATVVAAYLMKSRQMSDSAALALIRQKRPQICPNYGFLKQLDVFQECAYDPSPENAVYKAWKQKQGETITDFLNKVNDTIPIVKDQLYLSSDFPSEPAQGSCLLAEWGITHLLSISPSETGSIPPSVEHLHLDLSYGREFLLALPIACDFIREAIQSDGRVLVLSSRECSACITVCAYLMKSCDMSMAEAQGVLEKAMPLFSAPAPFVRHLKAFESCKCNPTLLVDDSISESPRPIKSSITATAASVLSETGLDLSAFGATLATIQRTSVLA